MIYIETETTDAYLNFGYEYYFADEKRLGDDVLLLWRTTPTLMLGKYQNPYEELDLDYARERRINLVRRFSGGGTIYTDPGGFQFSFIGDGTEDIEFSRYVTPVVEALKTLGIPAEADGRNDIVAEGKKISGNAQYKTSGRTVHHGSLLFDTDIYEMERATRLPEYKIKSKAVKSVRDRVVNIKSFLQEDMTADEFKSRLLSLLPVTGNYIPTDEDKKRIAELAEEKFGSGANLFGRTPNFTIEKTVRTVGGTFIVSFDVKRGMVADASVRGDFFSRGGTDSLVEALGNIPFDRESIRRAVLNSGFSAYGTEIEELAEKLSEGLKQENI